MPFEKVRAFRYLAATKFDLVLALGGSASYLSPDDWEALPQHAKGKYVLSVFAETEGPVTCDLPTESLTTARDLAREFAKQHQGRIVRLGRFEIVVAGR